MVCDLTTLGKHYNAYSVVSTDITVLKTHQMGCLSGFLSAYVDIIDSQFCQALKKMIYGKTIIQLKKAGSWLFAGASAFRKSHLL